MFSFRSKSPKEVLKESRPKENIRRKVSYRLIYLKSTKTNLSQTFFHENTSRAFLGAKGKDYATF